MTNPNKRRALVCAGLAVCSVLIAAAAQAQDVSFIVGRDFDVGGSPWSVAVGDFNGYGVQDLAVANSSFPCNVSVLLATGMGPSRRRGNLTWAGAPIRWRSAT